MKALFISYLLAVVLVFPCVAQAAGSTAVRDSAEPNLTLLRGTVSGDGTISAGSGFAVSHPACGQYIVTYIGSPFSSQPTIMLSVRRPIAGVEGGVQIGIIEGSVGPSGFSVFVNQPVLRTLQGTFYNGAGFPLPFGGTTSDPFIPTLGPGTIFGGPAFNLLRPGTVVTFQEFVNGVPTTETFTVPSPPSDFCHDVVWDFIVIGPR